MAFTSTVFDPEILTDYVTAIYFQSSTFVDSGLMDSMGGTGIESGGTAMTMPSWNILELAQTLEPGNDLVARKLTDKTEIHPVRRWYNLFNNLDIASIIAKGTDANQEVGNQISKNIRISFDTSSLRALQGSMGVVTANRISTTAAVDLRDVTAMEEIFGDIQEETLSAGGTLVMRSSIFKDYKDLGLVSDPTTGNQLQDGLVATGRFGSIMGYGIIKNDKLFFDNAGTLDATTGNPLTYLVGNKTMNSSVQKELNVEQDRDIKKQGQSISYNLHRTLGVKGVSWTATNDQKGPEDSDLITTTNWELKAEDNKLVGIAYARNTT